MQLLMFLCADLNVSLPSRLLSARLLCLRVLHAHTSIRRDICILAM